MKIKVIDMLVKIANGEKVPKKIKFKHSIWEYCKDGNTQDYINDYDKCLMEFLAINKDGLNQDVEIIEEPKKIEKLPKNITDNACATRDQRTIANKINELIDEISNLKGK